jgi:uncharacterized protein YoaH (UPF0181 family)
MIRDMPRQVGERVARAIRRRAIRQLQSLISVGISDEEAKAQVAETYNVTDRTTRNWMNAAYAEMTAEARVDREKLLGAALRRRRLIMARSAKEGDWKTVLAAADSESKLLGLNAPVETVNHLVVEKVGTISKAMVDVIKDFFADDLVGRDRFVAMMRARVNASLEQRPKPVTIEIGIDDGGPALADAGTDGTVVDASIEDSPDVAPPADPAADAPPSA